MQNLELRKVNWLHRNLTSDNIHNCLLIKIKQFVRLCLMSLVLMVCITPNLRAEETVRGWSAGSLGNNGKWCHPSILEACTQRGGTLGDFNPYVVNNYMCRIPDAMRYGGAYWEAIQNCYYVPLTLSLTGAVEARPKGAEGKDGKSTLDIIAKVTEGASPKPGVAVSFSVDVTPNSGGHEHHDAARPKGTLSGTQGTTDANGEVKLTFQAHEVAGIHTVKATCATCSNSPAAKEIQVKVPDLLPISPNAPQNTDGTFVYALTSVDKTHQGNGRYHHNQYYLTEQSQVNLQSMIAAFAAEGWGTMALNDASLFWGGRYDITSNWGAPHAAHRDGREIDISFTRAQNPVSAVKQKIFYKKFCETKTVQVPFSILHHYVLVPHFHVFLEKQTACFKSEH